MPAASIAALLLAAHAVLPASKPVEVRVGVVAFEDFHAERRQYHALLSEWTRRDPQLQFRVAVGTYGDVLHWIRQRQVDVAVLSPGVFAELVGGEGGPPAARAFEYLATLNLPPAAAPWAGEDRRQRGRHEWYRPVCLRAAASPLTSIDDLRQAAAAGNVEFLFVHPLSASGRRAAEFALRQIGVDPAKSKVRYTYSHSESIRLLAASHPNHPRVAFVWDDAAAGETELSPAVRRLPFPELDALQIPHDVVIAAAAFPHAARLRELLLETKDESGTPRFTAMEDWQEQYRRVYEWQHEAGGGETSGARAVSLDEIGQTLLHHARSQPGPPRLAVVLSGGGAKCSYQVGAVGALEEMLAELRGQAPGSKLDIGLVVGTSGGAINALPIALGISRTPEGRQAFADTWKRLDQREIVRPPGLVKANIGLWFALLQTALLVWLVRLFVRRPEKRGRAFAIVYTSLAAVEIVVGYVPFTPWEPLGTNHWLHHAWLWAGLGVRASAWSLLVLGVLALLLEGVRARRGRHIGIPNWLTFSTLATGLVGLPLLQLVTIATLEETLSGGEGMEQAVAARFPSLIDAHLEQAGLVPLEAAAATTDRERLQSVSRQIVDRILVQRDLVLTGSCLEQSSDELPSDLYFYLPANAENPAPPFGDRGVSLSRRPAILLDVMLGSGSIFPVFPARRIDGVPDEGDWIQLVDGGFAHNSPIEAAVLWGATHIVLIEASPRSRIERTNFLTNASASFSHLYQQAQLLDARSRERVVVFSLAPEPPHLCVLDFADNLIAESIERGYRDAAGLSGANSPRFQKESGMPVFSDVVVETAAPPAGKSAGGR